MLAIILLALFVIVVLPALHAGRAQQEVARLKAQLRANDRAVEQMHNTLYPKEPLAGPPIPPEKDIGAPQLWRG